MEGKQNGSLNKADDFIQVYRLFKELMQVISSKMRQAQSQPTPPSKVQQQPQQIVQKQQKMISSGFSESIPPILPAIKLKYNRDWQGLCSQRKQDVLGEYQVCFSYVMNQKQKEKEGEGGSFSNNSSFT